MAARLGSGENLAQVRVLPLEALGISAEDDSLGLDGDCAEKHQPDHNVRD
jgi:hypothetical protein